MSLSFGSSILSKLRSFKSDAGGNVIIMFAAGSMMLLTIAAGAVEMHRRSTAKTELQAALDSATLAGKQRQVGLSATKTKAEAQTAGKTMAEDTFNALIARSKNFAGTTVTGTFAWNADGSLAGTSSPMYSVLFGNFIPNEMRQLKAAATADYAQGLPTEVALVLDNTVSMFNTDGRTKTRFTLMREAAKKFTHQLFDAAQSVGDVNLVRVSVVPWATTVNLNGGAPATPDYSGSNTVTTIADRGSRIKVTTPLTRQGTEVTIPNGHFQPVEWRGCVSGADETTTYDDTKPTKKWPALRVPPTEPGTIDVAEGKAVTAYWDDCSGCPTYDDGKACWTPGGSGFLDQIKRAVPQIKDAAFLLNKDLKDADAPKTDPACVVCVPSYKCIKRSYTTYDCTGKSTKKEKMCWAWDMYGRQNPYHRNDNNNCFDHYITCHAPGTTAALKKSVKACLADPNEPAVIAGTVPWCAAMAYWDSQQWASKPSDRPNWPISGPNMNCPAPMLGLSGNRKQVIEYLDRMTPVPGGTHSDVGMRWGLRTLSPNNAWPAFFGMSKAPAAFGDTANKIMILLTDGENEQALDFPGYWGCQGAYGPGGNSGQPDCLGAPDVTELNSRMTKWCTAIRNTYKVTVYAISINVPGMASKTVLTDCTGDSAKVFAIDAADLTSVLSGIGTKIMAMRLIK